MLTLTYIPPVSASVFFVWRLFFLYDRIGGHPTTCALQYLHTYMYIISNHSSIKRNYTKKNGFFFPCAYLVGGAVSCSHFLAAATPESSFISGNALLLLILRDSSDEPGRPNRSSVASRLRSFSNTMIDWRLIADWLNCGWYVYIWKWCYEFCYI